LEPAVLDDIIDHIHFVGLQGFVELAALEDILDPYLDYNSRNNFELSKKHLGAWDIQGDER
jgi:hypothetical protein